jgi:hypothetical protein
MYAMGYDAGIPGTARRDQASLTTGQVGQVPTVLFVIARGNRFRDKDPASGILRVTDDTPGTAQPIGW